MMDLYGVGSPNVVKIAIMLEELGLDYRLLHVAVFEGGQFSPEFLGLNPLGRVPVLVAPDGQAVFESGAILIFLAENYGGEVLLPANGLKRIAVLQWLMVQMANIGPMFGQHNHFIITPAERDSYAGRRYRSQAHDLYALLDRRLGQTAFLAGDAYSIADIATYPWALYVERHGFDWSDFPHLADWRDRIGGRPAVAKATAAMAAFNAAHAGGAVTQAGLDRFFRRAPGGPATDFSPMMVR